MNTMDEVIKGLECCELGSMYSMCESCPYTGIDNCNVKIQEDALHYLKKYREEYKALVKTINEAIDVEMKYYHMIEELEPNSPLTWDELRTMEGKPVWVEILSDEIDLSSRWMMVARETKAHSLPLAYTDDIGHWIYGHEDKLGKTWQAYRKEQFNTEYEDIPMEYFENGGI